MLNIANMSALCFRGDWNPLFTTTSVKRCKACIHCAYLYLKTLCFSSAPHVLVCGQSSTVAQMSELSLLACIT